MKCSHLCLKNKHITNWASVEHEVSNHIKLYVKKVKIKYWLCAFCANKCSFFWPMIRIIFYHCRKMRLQMKAQKPLKRIFPPLNKINKNTWVKTTGWIHRSAVLVLDPLCFRWSWKTKINFVFKYQFTFRHILEYFFPRKWNLRSVTESIRSIGCQRGYLLIVH